MLLPLLAGSLVNLLLSQVVVDNLSGVGELLSTLYAGGKTMLCAGVLGTLIAFALEKAFSIYGAAILLLLAFIFFALSAFSVTPKKLFDFLRTEKPEKAERKPAKAAAAPEPEEPGEEKTEKIKKARRRAIDIPLDDEPAFTKNRPHPRSPQSRMRPRPKRRAACSAKRPKKKSRLPPIISRSSP